MKIGLGLPSSATSPTSPPSSTSPSTAEAAGFDSLWVMDRLLAPVDPRTPYPASTDGELPPEQSSCSTRSSP